MPISSVSYKAIGRNIREARSKRKLTQEQIAERLKISQLHFGRLERGERPISLDLLADIANVLDVTVGSLLAGSIAGEDFISAPQDAARALGDSVSSLSTGCSEKARRLILALCQAVVENDKYPSMN